MVNRKACVGVFGLLAAAAIVLGLIAAFKPDAYKKSSSGGEAIDTKSQGVSLTPTTSSQDAVAEITQTGTTTPTFPNANPGSPNVAKPDGPSENKGLFTGIQQIVSDKIQGAADKPMATPAGDALAGALAKNDFIMAQGATASQMAAAISKAGGNTTDPSKLTMVVASAMKDQFISSMQAGEACAPADGDALRAAIDGTCVAITLAPGVTYDIGDSELVVGSPKVIIGNPVNLPIIDGSGSERIFHVVAGGSLDISFVQTYRGGGRLVATIPVLVGGSALVELGGRLNAFGVVFTNKVGPNPAVFIAPDISRAVRIFGGQVAVMGGVATITASLFYTLQPGVFIREFYVVGGDVLVGAGLLLCTATVFTNDQLFLNGWGVGFMLAQIGGVMVLSGVAFWLNTMLIHASGAGILTFLGAGVAVVTACAWNANLGVLIHFGAGIFLFVGAGAAIVSGCAFNANIAIGIEAGVGALVCLGAGQLTMNGVTLSANLAINYISETGIKIFVGAGNAILTGMSWSRVGAIVSVAGVGGDLYNNGLSVVVGAVTADVYSIASIVLPGVDYFIPSGLLVEVGGVSAKVIAIGFLIVPGLHAFIGAGAAVTVGTEFIAVLSPLTFIVLNGLYLVNGQRFYVDAAVAGAVVATIPSAAEFFYRRLKEMRFLGDAPVQCAGSLTSYNPSTPKASSAKASYLVNKLGLVVPDYAYANVSSSSAAYVCGGDGSIQDEIVGDGVKQYDATCSKDIKAVDCSGNQQPLPAFAQALLGGQVPTVDGKSTKDVILVQGFLNLACSAADGAAKPEACTTPDKIKKAITDNVAFPDGCTFDASVQNANGYVPSALKDLVPVTDTGAFNLESNSEVKEGYAVTLTTWTDKCAKNMADWLVKAQPDTDTPLKKTLSDIEGSNKDVVVDAASIVYDTTHTVPLVTSKQELSKSNKNAQLQSALGPVLALDQNLATTPFYNAGDSVGFTSGNFGAGDITYKLIKVAKDEAGNVVQSPVDALTQVVKGNNIGDQQDVSIPLVKGNVPPGQYFIQASQGAFTALSRVFDVAL